jgi:MoaA/NifB/PqqE/SkfB family radical SAM enzyme
MSFQALRIEASSHCQLKCPRCPTGVGKTKSGVVGSGYLRAADFENFISRHPEIMQIEFSNWGEIFLNPELARIIEVTHAHNISMSARNGVNLNHITEPQIDALVRCKFGLLSVSIDGASEETYQVYRRGGSFNQVIHNVERINDKKRQYASMYPKLRWQFIVFGHNEHELEKAQLLAEKLGMEFYAKLNASPDYSPIVDSNAVRKYVKEGVASRSEYKVVYKKPYSLPCRQLWDQPQINWDGKLLGCCVNVYGDFGNVFETSLEACVESTAYVKAKAVVSGEEMADPNCPCYHCPVYRNDIKPKFQLQRVNGDRNE